MAGNSEAFVRKMAVSERKNKDDYSFCVSEWILIWYTGRLHIFLKELCQPELKGTEAVSKSLYTPNLSMSTKKMRSLFSLKQGLFLMEMKRKFWAWNQESSLLVHFCHLQSPCGIFLPHCVPIFLHISAPYFSTDLSSVVIFSLLTGLRIPISTLKDKDWRMLLQSHGDAETLFIGPR